MKRKSNPEGKRNYSQKLLLSWLQTYNIRHNLKSVAFTAKYCEGGGKFYRLFLPCYAQYNVKEFAKIGSKCLKRTIILDETMPFVVTQIQAKRKAYLGISR